MKSTYRNNLKHGIEYNPLILIVSDFSLLIKINKTAVGGG